MIIYFDSSVLVKSVIDEPGSHELIQFMVETAKFEDLFFAASAVSKAEVMAALGAMHRGKEISNKKFQAAVTEFNEKWKNFFIPSQTDSLIERSGNLGLNHKLKGCDAFQLASALEVKSDLFICSDNDLNNAASENGCKVWNPMKDAIPNIDEISSPQNVA